MEKKSQTRLLWFKPQNCLSPASEPLHHLAHQPLHHRAPQPLHHEAPQQLHHEVPPVITPWSIPAIGTPAITPWGTPGITSWSNLAITPVLSNRFDNAGRTRHNHEAAGRTSKFKRTTKICWTLIYCICVIVIFWNQRLSITYVCTCYFWQYITPLLSWQTVTNLGPLPLSMSHFLSTN